MADRLDPGLIQTVILAEPISGSVSLSGTGGTVSTTPTGGGTALHTADDDVRRLLEDILVLLSDIHERRGGTRDAL